MILTMHSMNLSLRSQSCGEKTGRAFKEERSGCQSPAPPKRKQAYVDRQTSSQSTLYVYRPCAAHPAVEPGRDSPYTDRHFPQYQYSGDLGCVDLYRAQSRGHRDAGDDTLSEGSDDARLQ